MGALWYSPTHLTCSAFFVPHQGSYLDTYMKTSVFGVSSLLFFSLSFKVLGVPVFGLDLSFVQNLLYNP